MSAPILRLGYFTDGGAARVRAEADRLPAGFAAALDHQANLNVEELQKRTPRSRSGRPGYHSGQLAANWAVQRSGAGATARRTIYNKLRYLRFVLKGRKAIDQTLKPASERHPLHFWIDGHEFYRWRVKAAPANNFVPAAVAAARRRALPALQADLRNAIFSQSLVSYLGGNPNVR